MVMICFLSSLFFQDHQIHLMMGSDFVFAFASDFQFEVDLGFALPMDFFFALS